MVKHFCDACGAESDGFNWAERWAPVRQMNGTEFRVVKVIVAKNGTSNDAELCRECMVELVTKGAFS
jgi:hypothetical protein